MWELRKSRSCLFTPANSLTLPHRFDVWSGRHGFEHVGSAEKRNPVGSSPPRSFERMSMRKRCHRRIVSVLRWSAIRWG